MTPPDDSTLRALLAPWGSLRPQPATDWRGPIALPPALVDLHATFGPWGETVHASIGPIGLSIDAGGNPVDVPPLARLWDLQAGYRWNAVTGERSPDWSDDWIVFALQGGDPFILDAATGRVLFALHGARRWEPEPLADGVRTALGGVATVANALAAIGDAARDATFELTAEARAAVVADLGTFLGGADEARAFLAAWRWSE
jgi:hypothetical protein